MNILEKIINGILYGTPVMLIGLFVVFAMLTILICCIMAMSGAFNKIKKSKEEKEIASIIKECVDYIKAHRAEKPEVATKIVTMCTSAGFSNPTLVTDINLARQIKAYLDEQK